jgi:hypothetical protein
MGGPARTREAYPRNMLMATVRNELKVARDDRLIDFVPATPRVRQNDNPRSFFRFAPLVPSRRDEYQRRSMERRSCPRTAPISESRHEHGARQTGGAKRGCEVNTLNASEQLRVSPLWEHRERSTSIPQVRQPDQRRIIDADLIDGDPAHSLRHRPLLSKGLRK